MPYNKRISKSQRKQIVSARKQSKSLKVVEAERYLIAIRNRREVEALGHSVR